MASIARQWIRHWLLPQTSEPRTVRLGLLRGIKLFMDPRSGLQNQYGLAERELHPWFRKFSRDAKTAIDLGAAEGDYTLYYLKKTPAEKVIAFDCQEHCRVALHQNLALNGLDGDPRVQVVGKFVGSALNDGEVSLDDFLPQIQTPCVIKMDVERNEYPVLMGCPELLKLKDVRWIIEIHTPELDVLCRDLLEKNGYRVTSIQPAWWRRFISETRGDYIRWMAASK